MGDRATHPDATQAGNGRGRAWYGGRPRWAEAVGVAVASSLLFVLGFGGGLSRLQNPLGGGDLLQAYAAARVWSEGAPYGSTSFGWPFGFERRYYPTSDGLQNALAGLVTWATGNPFLGIHTVFALSFPVTALAALWVFRLVGLRGPWAVLGMLALTFLPYHWYRLEHVYLATMYSAVLGVGLALLVGNGTVERRLRERPRRRFVLLLAALVLVIATSGIYYACFTAVLCMAACVWRLLRGARWRDLLLAVIPGIAVLAVLAAVLLPTVLYVREHPPLDPVAARGVEESVVYAGALVLALLPAPVSHLPGAGWLNSVSGGALPSLGDWPLSEMHLLSNFGSLATLAAIVILAGGGVLGARRSAYRPVGGPSAPEPGGPGAMGLIVLLLVTTLLFFVPWGLNFLFAYLVSPDIRAWNRLLPMMFTLVFLGAGLMVQRLGLRLRPAVAVGLFVVALLVLVFDSVLPARGFFAAAAAEGTPFGKAGYSYAEALNEAVPGHCSVLELPYIPYPEFPPKNGMGNYEPLWPALINPEKSWSAAAMKGTEASEWQAALGDALDERDIAPLAAGGFCAVHVDRRGYSGQEVDEVVGELTEMLGEPVAIGFNGNWVAFAIPGAVAENPDPAALKQAREGIGTFYSPPRITPGTGAPTVPALSLHHVTWSLAQGPAAFDVESLPEGAAFRRVEGQLQAGDCGARDVVVTLRSGGQEVSRTVETNPAAATTFSVELDQSVRQAQLTVTTSSLTVPTWNPVCDDDPPTTTLIDPRAVN